jgi:hypothetical protein
VSKQWTADSTEPGITSGIAIFNTFGKFVEMRFDTPENFFKICELIEGAERVGEDRKAMEVRHQLERLTESLKR